MKVAQPWREIHRQGRQSEARPERSCRRRKDCAENSEENRDYRHDRLDGHRAGKLPCYPRRAELLQDKIDIFSRQDLRALRWHDGFPPFF